MLMDAYWKCFLCHNKSDRLKKILPRRKRKLPSLLPSIKPPSKKFGQLHAKKRKNGIARPCVSTKLQIEGEKSLFEVFSIWSSLTQWELITHWSQKVDGPPDSRASFLINFSLPPKWRKNIFESSLCSPLVFVGEILDAIFATTEGLPRMKFRHPFTFFFFFYLPRNKEREN